MIQHRKKEYIRNCTGKDCAVENSHKMQIFSRVLFYILLVGFLGTAIYIILFSSYLQITTINVSGNTTLQSSDIQQALQSQMDGKYLKAIPKNNFALITEGRDENFLKSEFKKIKSVSVTKVFPDTINVSVQEYAALLVWCKADDQCFMIDDNGIAYEQADFSSPEMSQNNLIKIKDDSGQDVAIGSQVLDPTFAAYVLGLKDALSGIGITLDESAFETPSRMSEEIDAKTTSGEQLLFSTQFDQASAVDALKLVLAKQIPQDQQDNVTYIDLRSQDRAFYVMNGQDPNSSTAADAAEVANSSAPQTPAPSDNSSDDKKKK